MVDDTSVVTVKAPTSSVITEIQSDTLSMMKYSIKAKGTFLWYCVFTTYYQIKCIFTINNQKPPPPRQMCRIILREFGNKYRCNLQWLLTP